MVLPPALFESSQDVSHPTMTRGVGVRVRVYHGTTKTQRQKALDQIAEKGGICLTTYGESPPLYHKHNTVTHTSMKGCFSQILRI